MYVPGKLGTYGSAFSDIAIPQKEEGLAGIQTQKEFKYYLYVRLEK